MEYYIIKGRQWPKCIFEIETPAQREDRLAMEGKITIYDIRCGVAACNNFANLRFMNMFICDSCRNNIAPITVKTRFKSGSSNYKW